MCFAPQRHALFQHLNFQKWSGAEVFCTFSLRNRLRTTTACNFSSLISPDVSAPARFSQPTFRPSGATKPRKTQCFATFLPFRAPASSFFWSFLFWHFSLLTAFSSLHIVGSLTSKLPSMIFLWDFCGISMGFLCGFYAICILFHDLSMDSMGLWDVDGISMGFLWGYYAIPTRFLLDFHDVSMIFLWDYFPWYFYGISKGFLCNSYGISMIVLWSSMNFYGVPVYGNPVIFLRYFYGITMICPRWFYGIPL